VKRFAAGIVTSEQTTLIADAEIAVGELMHSYRTAHEMSPLFGGRQLQDQVLEGHGVVVAHHPRMLRGEHQLQLDAGQLDEGAFLVRRLDREAAIEVRDEDLLEIAIGWPRNR
jgi:hypothetical protein